MDFLGGFPTVEGVATNSTMMVIMDIFLKYVIFIAVPSRCPTVLAAKLFFTHVVKIFRLPEDIISDRDPKFTGRF